RKTSPLARVPMLIRDDGSALIDSAVILDWLDREVGPDRALLPSSGIERDRAMQRVALGCGAVDKVGAAAYERIIRPSRFRWPEWIARCHAGRRRDCGTERHGMAERRGAQSGGDYDLLHDRLRQARRSGPDARWQVPHSRCASIAPRGTAGI